MGYGWVMSILKQWQQAKQPLFSSQQHFLTTSQAPLEVTLYQGGFGCGKTHAAVLLGLELALTQPNTTGMVVAKGWATLRDAIIPRYMAVLRTMGYTENVDYQYRRTQRKFIFANGSEIWFRPVGYSKAWLSLECQWLHAEEIGLLTQDTFQLLLTRLRQPVHAPNGQLYPLRFFATTTPVHGWLREAFQDDARPAHYRKIHGQTAENTVLSPAYHTMLQASWPTTLHSCVLDGQDMTDAQAAELAQPKRHNVMAVEPPCTPTTRLRNEQLDARMDSTETHPIPAYPERALGPERLTDPTLLPKGNNPPWMNGYQHPPHYASLAHPPAVTLDVDAILNQPSHVLETVLPKTNPMQSKQAGYTAKLKRWFNQAQFLGRQG
jgi:hypothetical protein